MTLIRKDFDDCLTLTSGPLTLMWYRREVRSPNGSLYNPPQFMAVSTDTIPYGITASLINWDDAEQFAPDHYHRLVAELTRQRTITAEGFETPAQVAS